MSQAAVEQILGRLLTDADFREGFFSGAAEAILHQYALSESEQRALHTARTALHKLDFALQESRLDPSICRAEIRSASLATQRNDLASNPDRPYRESPGAVTGNQGEKNIAAHRKVTNVRRTALSRGRWNE